METKDITRTRKMQILAVAIIFIAVLFGTFQAGVFVGFHKASFFFKSGDNFYNAFGNRGDRLIDRMGRNGEMFRDELSGGHGAVGSILRVNLPSIIVVGPDTIEKEIIVNEDTIVRQLRETSSINDLRVDQHISVLGAPNDQGQIVAKFIRIVPAQQMRGMMNASTTRNTVSTSSIITR
jgi:hypothetical protein